MLGKGRAFCSYTTAKMTNIADKSRGILRNINILIADDHEVVRRGLCAVLEMDKTFSVVGEAESGNQAFEQAKKTKPDIVIMDIMMADMDGISASKMIKKECSNTKVIILTAMQSDKDIFEALGAGVSGYLHKDIRPSELINAIKTVADGQSLFDSQVASKFMTQFSTEQSSMRPMRVAQQLTCRETEVLQFMASGMRNKEIAQRMFVSEKTVKTHVSNILRKLGQNDRTQAALYAIRTGLIGEVEN